MKKILLLAAVLFCSNIFSQDTLFPKIKRMIDSVSPANLVKHIKILENASGYKSRVNFTPGDDSAVVYLKNTFQSMPNLKVELDTFYISSATPPYNTKPLFNVVATSQGKSSQYIVIGAHHDCSASRMGSSTWNSQWKTIKAPGADDNATGLAGILEMARIISDTSFNFFKDYTIKFIAFGAEEYGPAYSGHHHGSLSIANKAKAKNDTIIAMISFDMIGYNPNFFYQSIVSNTASTWIGNKLIEAKDRYSLNVIINPPPFVNADYSDHDSFWQAGYNAVLLIENAPPWNNGNYYTANPFYHTSSDTFETLNMNLVKKITQLCLAAVCNLSKNTTDVKDNNEINVDGYYLSQNYPNPFSAKGENTLGFNRTTIINFQIPKQEYVTLKIFDLLGKEIATLVNEEKNQGSYKISFDATKYDLSNGVYFYQLKAGSFINTKKFILIK